MLMNFQITSPVPHIVFFFRIARIFSFRLKYHAFFCSNNNIKQNASNFRQICAKDCYIYVYTEAFIHDSQDHLVEENKRIKSLDST